MSLFEQVNETVRYAKAPTAIGVVTHGDKAILVDSGLDENLVRKVLNSLEREGVSVAAIVNTHAHADHFGGNSFAHKRTGCRVVAPAYEHLFMERPELEGWSIFGAPAPQSLRGKFILAPPSPVHEHVEHEGMRSVEGFDVRFHSLPGHSVGQMGIEIDGVLFTGDALLPERIVEKYGLVFAVDPHAQRASTRLLLERAPQHVVSYHGGLVEDLERAVRVNVETSERVEAMLLRSLERTPKTDEELFAEICDTFGEPSSVELHVLNLSTMRSYLAAMERAGRVETLLMNRRLHWKTK